MPGDCGPMLHRGEGASGARGLGAAGPQTGDSTAQWGCRERPKKRAELCKQKTQNPRVWEAWWGRDVLTGAGEKGWGGLRGGRGPGGGRGAREPELKRTVLLPGVPLIAVTQEACRELAPQAGCSSSIGPPRGHSALHKGQLPPGETEHLQGQHEGMQPSRHQRELRPTEWPSSCLQTRQPPAGTQLPFYQMWGPCTVQGPSCYVPHNDCSLFFLALSGFSDLCLQFPNDAHHLPSPLQTRILETASQPCLGLPPPLMSVPSHPRHGLRHIALLCLHSRPQCVCRSSSPQLLGEVGR